MSTPASAADEDVSEASVRKRDVEDNPGVEVEKGDEVDVLGSPANDSSTEDNDSAEAEVDNFDWDEYFEFKIHVNDWIKPTTRTML